MSNSTISWNNTVEIDKESLKDKYSDNKFKIKSNIKIKLKIAVMNMTLKSVIL